MVVSRERILKNKAIIPKFQYLKKKDNSWVEGYPLSKNDLKNIEKRRLVMKERGRINKIVSYLRVGGTFAQMFQFRNVCESQRSQQMWGSENGKVQTARWTSTF